MAYLCYFDGRVAKEVGVEAAVLFCAIQDKVLESDLNGSNFFDGKYWTHSSVSDFAKLLPFLGKSTIRGALKKLELKGYIVTGNYNKSKLDRSKWYALGEYRWKYWGE